MKNLIIAVITILAVVGITWAGGQLSKDDAGVVIMGHVPNPAGLANTSLTGTKVSTTVDVSTAATLKITCTDASGDVKACKATPNGQTAYIAVPTGQAVIPLTGSKVTSFTLSNYSSASPSTTVFHTEKGGNF